MDFQNIQQKGYFFLPYDCFIYVYGVIRIFEILIIMYLYSTNLN